ncbi:G/U mismatch-specific DNA glycosylase [Streptomyces sp. col6]|uniref:G/U mismatch-specific DNA glycosylase n=1 Tax=Streptomyces sp. col6 TaxID=2478958 RepID=UPI0011CEB869|nr:G/U mismatch-specific DNA glycosylase [Streptomyces sp. col6]TXR99676.1 G/U mismatch-specific DNA glycosylase [Streptomyces sp. col6]
MTPESPRKRYSRADLEAARSAQLPDLVCPGLLVLFCGINPGLRSAASGLHFNRPGNRFWPALHLSGFTPRLFTPQEQHKLLPLGLGISDIVDRPTAAAQELTEEELREGGRHLTAKIERLRPAWVAPLGITGYRTAFAGPDAVIGPQESRIGPARVWVLPNPSGRNTHFPLPALTQEFARLRRACGIPDRRTT